MNPKSLTRSLAALVVCTLPVHAPAESCSAKSPQHTAALVELYTSEGCSSCPPADKWLSTLGKPAVAPGGLVVPIALHVDYWDYIGWKDPYAKREFSARQRKLAALGRASFVYTPQVLLQGRDFRGWGSSAFDDAVASINARMAKAAISLAIDPQKTGALAIQTRAELLDPGQHGDAALYLAAYENKLVSEVKAGENEGRTLAHDFVVLEWSGPIAFGRDGRVHDKRTLALLPKAVAANSGVVAFVQNRRTGEVLQALMLPSCPG
jgi:hypothetical protein